MIVGILHRIGFYISFKKLSTPAQDIDSVKMELRLPEDKISKLLTQLRLCIGGKQRNVS